MSGPGVAARRLVRVLLCMSLLILALEPAAGQQFLEEITVEEIEIPVHVVRKGRSVAGLTREDFQVFVDGEPVDIVGFTVLERHAAGEPEASEAVQAPAASPTPAKRPRHFLLLFDALFAGQHDLLRVLRGAREMTSRQLEPEDRVALAYLTSSGATILVGFTRDRKELELGLDVMEAGLKRGAQEVRASLARLRRHVGREGGDAQELADLSERFGSTAALAFGDRLAPGVNVASIAGGIESRTFDPTLESAADARRDRARSDDIDRGDGQTRFPEDERPSGADPVRSSLVAERPEELAARLAEAVEGSGVRFLTRELERLAILLRDVPNPKEILYFSRGFSSSILSAFGSPEQARVLRHLGEMHEALLGGGWVLHGIDLAGIPASGPGQRPGFDAHALFYMANETGGQIMENYNRMDQATLALLGRTRVTYLLTIQPDSRSPDGRRHRIKVKLRERRWGTRVDHRPAYYADGVGESSSPLEAELQTMREWLGDEEDNPLAAVVHAERVRDAGGANRVRLMMEIPGSVVTGERAAGVASLEIRTVVLDTEGGVQASWSRTVSLNLAKVGHRLRNRRVCLRTEFEVPPGPHRLRTVVRMTERNARSLLTTPVAESWRGLPSYARRECLELNL